MSPWGYKVVEVVVVADDLSSRVGLASCFSNFQKKDDNAMPSERLGEGLQMLLQVFAQREVLSYDEVKGALQDIGQSVAPGQRDDVDQCLKQINKYLKTMLLEIRGYHAGNGTKKFALINVSNDDVAKDEGGAVAGPAEAAIFRNILATLAEAPEYTTLFGDLDRLRGKLSAAKFETFVDDLCRHHWLEKHEGDYDEDPDITFGPRTYTELADHLRTLGVDVPQQIVP